MAATAAQARELWQAGVLGVRIKELVRIRSAQVNGCVSCASAVKEPTVDADDVACLTLATDGFDDRETAAVDLVADIAWRPAEIDDERIDQLLALFSPAELVELVYHVCVMLGQHRFHHVFGAGEDGVPRFAFAPELVDGTDLVELDRGDTVDGAADV